jgi:hypothetical protein
MGKILSICKGVSLTAVLAVALCVGTGAAFAGDNDNGTAAAIPLTTTPKATNGSVKCTASVNSDGSVLACKHCNPADTSHLLPGEYQVGFKKPCQNILAVNGWSRWVQADTLSTGNEKVFCTTADRAGDANAIYVQCEDADGTLTDASFFLFVAR